MVSEQFKNISLKPEDAVINIDAMINAALFLNMVNEQSILADVLTVASDYVATIRKEQERVIQEGR
ncbi:hypothetical protein ACMV5I_26960 [Serratia sp. T13T92]|uniref:hypothetical protein n=1 Tax=Serratia TaxID=613 RepID=UPI001377BB16|nr:hypothetical protein [Serratia fonticola]NBJ34743.1 hypothetical protein [Serratia fonticola]